MALSKLQSTNVKSRMQQGWYYSLDLEPPDSFGSELSVLGIGPPDPSLELIASGVGFVCTTGHVLTLRQVITHPHHAAASTTIAVVKQDGSWALVPVKQVVQGDKATDLAMLVVENVNLNPVCFDGTRDKPKGEITVLGLQRGPEILNAGIKSEKGTFQAFDEQNQIFKTTAIVHAGNRGGPCIDTVWRVVGLGWQGTTGNESRGICYSVDAITAWTKLNLPNVSLNMGTAASPKEQRDNLRKSVVPILVWGKKHELQNPIYGRFFNSNNLDDLLVIRDDWCNTCSGKSILTCRTCRGSGEVQTGIARVQIAFDPISGKPLFGEVPTKGICGACNGWKKVSCPHCENGKLKGGTGIGIR